MNRKHSVAWWGYGSGRVLLAVGLSPVQLTRGQNLTTRWQYSWVWGGVCGHQVEFCGAGWWHCVVLCGAGWCSETGGSRGNWGLGGGLVLGASLHVGLLTPLPLHTPVLEPDLHLQTYKDSTCNFTPAYVDLTQCMVYVFQCL